MSSSMAGQFEWDLISKIRNKAGIRKISRNVN